MKTQEVKKDKSNKKRFSLVAYIKETIAELKRVTWSTKKELLKNTPRTWTRNTCTPTSYNRFLTVVPYRS